MEHRPCQRRGDRRGRAHEPDTKADQRRPGCPPPVTDPLHPRDTPHDSRSAGKTFASVLLGAAMRQGVKLAPETKVYDLLAGMGPFANPDPRKSQITLA